MKYASSTKAPDRMDFFGAPGTRGVAKAWAGARDRWPKGVSFGVLFVCVLLKE